MQIYIFSIPKDFVNSVLLGIFCIFRCIRAHSVHFCAFEFLTNALAYSIYGLNAKVKCPYK